MRVLISAAFLAMALFVDDAAVAQVAAPQLGWVPDGSRIRPVSGIPAAAAVGPAVAAGQEFSQVAPSPARDYVLVSDLQSGAVSVYTPENGLKPLDGAGSGPDQIVLSPGGSTAALWFSSIGQVQVVSGLPEAPAIRQVNVSFLGALSAAQGALAISDDGAWIGAASAADVYTVGPSGDVSRLPIDDQVTSLAFLKGAHDLAMAGPSGLYLANGVGGFATVSTLLSAALRPAGVAAVSGNQTLVVADQSGSVIAVDIASKGATTFDCGCRPEGLFSLAPSAFRLTSLHDGAFKLFDATRGEVLFAPVALAEKAERGLGARR